MGRVRHGALGTAPWRRAPLLLFRQPPLLAAVVGASLVLGSAAAVGPVFLSSSANAALARQVAGRCQFSSGVSVSTPPGAVNSAQSLGRLSGAVRVAAAELVH